MRIVLDATILVRANENDIVVVLAAVIGEADVNCTTDADSCDPRITRFLTRVGIWVMDDATLMRKMRG